MKFLYIFVFQLILNLLLYIIDSFICIPFIVKFKKNLSIKDFNRTRWYLLHIFINILTAITSFSGIYQSYYHLTDSLNPIEMAKPFTLNWLYGPSSPFPTMLVASGHLYHILRFSVTKDDIYHHLLFALSMSTINMLCNYGYARNIVSFSLSGLPGIFEYTIMVLYKLNYLTKKNMRYLVTFFHTFLRFPLGLITFIHLFYQVLFNHLMESKINVLIVSLLLLVNITQYLIENIKSSINHYKKNIN